jgi:uncharacterized protein
LSHVLAIRVTPRSAKPGIGSWRAGADGREELEVRVAEAPADGAANEAIVTLLAKALRVSRSELAIISGAASRHKRIAIPFDVAEARGRLAK